MINLPRIDGGWEQIVCDPPWRLKTNSVAKPGRNAMGKYRCMTMADIIALREPILDVAAPDCLLWLWATNPMFPQQVAVAEAWGFRYSTQGHWVKTTKHGKLAFGTGFILRNAGEPFIIAKRGKPKTTRVVRSVIMGTVRAHSQKPEEAYREAERLMPDARRLELFARQRREKWIGWGNELDLFDANGNRCEDLPDLPEGEAA